MENRHRHTNIHFTEELEDALVAAVAERPALYDKSAKNWANRWHTEKQWKEIARELCLDANYCDALRKKWMSMRDYFQRSHKRLRNEQNDSSAKKWYRYDSMTFLIPHVKEKPPTGKRTESAPGYISDDTSNSLDGHSVDNIKAALSSPSGSLSPESTHEDVDNNGSYPTQSQFYQGPEAPDNTSFSNLTSQDVVTAVRNSRKRKLYGKRVAQVQVSSNLLTSFTNNVVASESSQTLDEDEMYCLSLAPKMKMLDIVTKLECQVEMQRVLLKYLMLSRSRFNDTSASQL